MLSLNTQLRKIDIEPKALRKQGVLPAILYGTDIENVTLQVDRKEFEKVYKEAGETTLISVKIGKEKEFTALIHEVQKNPLTGEFIHIDFHQPSLKKETEAKIPLEFIGESKAIKELGGTLIKTISELEVKALPQNLPHEIKVDIESLETFEDNIIVKDLKLPEGVKFVREPGDIVASITPPTKVEEELEKPIEEKLEEVEKVGEKEKEEKEEEKAVEDAEKAKEKKETAKEENKG